MAFNTNRFAKYIAEGKTEVAQRYLKERGADLTSLDLSTQQINTPEKFAALGAVLKGSNITHLDLPNNAINTPQAIAALGEALNGSNITSLSLAINGITNPEALLALGPVLQNSKVTNLDLALNTINTQGAVAALSEALQNSNVTTLDLSQTGINTPATITALGAALQGSKVTTLNLSGNNISTPAALAALSTALNPSNVTSLNLAGNNSNKNECNIFEFLQQTPKIYDLNLDENGLAPEETAAINNQLVERRIDAIKNHAVKIGGGGLFALAAISVVQQGFEVDTANLPGFAIIKNWLTTPVKSPVSTSPGLELSNNPADTLPDLDTVDLWSGQSVDFFYPAPKEPSSDSWDSGDKYSPAGPSSSTDIAAAGPSSSSNVAAPRSTWAARVSEASSVSRDK